MTRIHEMRYKNGYLVIIFNIEKMNDDDLKGFAIEPKRDCPHLKPSEVEALVEFLTKINTKHFSEFACA
jgi:hypothetical protein